MPTSNCGFVFHSRVQVHAEYLPDAPFELVREELACACAGVEHARLRTDGLVNHSPEGLVVAEPFLRIPTAFGVAYSHHRANLFFSTVGLRCLGPATRRNVRNVAIRTL